MSILDWFRKKKPQPAIRSSVAAQEPQPAAEQPNDRLDDIIAYLKEKTALSAYRIVFEPDAATDLFASKLGGVPYWNDAADYPADADGHPLYLLLQLNLDTLGVTDERLPQGGMLQFFISQLEDCCGKVVYHPAINYRAVAREDLPHMPCDDLLPVQRETAIRLEAFEDYISTSCYHFDTVFREAVQAVTGDNIGEKDWYDYLTENDGGKLADVFSGTGSKLFGYPVFTQWDPREDGTPYPLLLLQTDSDLKEHTMMWGDCGEGNFFIGAENLTAHDYADVLYYWDCC